MAIKETKQSSDSLEQEVRDVEAAKVQALSAILPTLDLPEDETNPEEELQEIRNKESREIRKKQQEGQEKSIKQYGDDEEPEQEEDNDEEEDDLIPKSKVDKRFKQLTAKIKELETANSRQVENAPIADADQQKLDSMTKEQLLKTLKDVRTKSLLLASSQDEGEKAMLSDYVDLEMKVHESIGSYKNRFYNEQVRQMQPIVDAIAYDEDIESPEQALKDIKQIAENIYSKYPKMQSLKVGMKQAYELAIDHYKLMQDKDVNKSESKRVKRENQRLKRKTTLDTSKIKGDKNLKSKKVDLIRQKMKSGVRATDTDRKDFVKANPVFNVDDLLPDSFK